MVVNFSSSAENSTELLEGVAGVIYPYPCVKCGVTGGHFLEPVRLPPLGRHIGKNSHFSLLLLHYLDQP